MHFSTVVGFIDSFTSDGQDNVHINRRTFLLTQALQLMRYLSAVQVGWAAYNRHIGNIP